MSTPSLRLDSAAAPAQLSTAAAAVSFAERFFAGLLLLLFLPLLAVVLVAVALASGKSPLIAHRRVGQFGADFWMLKIRTMWDGAGRSAGGGWIEYLPETRVPAEKCAHDPRVTSRMAAFFRRFSIDELPQLAHVLSGRMRLVGPRPVTRQEWDQYYGPAAAEVLFVPPGMTGLWQVLGRNKLTYAQRRRLDLFYSRRQSLLLDLLLLWRTPSRVLSGRDAG